MHIRDTNILVAVLLKTQIKKGCGTHDVVALVLPCVVQTYSMNFDCRLAWMTLLVFCDHPTPVTFFGVRVYITGVLGRSSDCCVTVK